MAPKDIPMNGFSNAETSCGSPSSFHDGCRFEVLPGLWVRLSGEDIITDKSGFDDDPDSPDCNFFVCADDAILGDFFLMARNIRVQGQLRRFGSEEHGRLAVLNLTVSMESCTLDPLADKKKVLDFLDKFGLRKPVTVPPTDGMNLENNENNVPPALSSNDKGPEDLSIPSAKVLALNCKISDNVGLNFPDCEGGSDCSLRLILEYYCRSILNGMDSKQELEDNSKIGMKSSTGDVASAYVGLVVGATGAALLGPVGWVAGMSGFVAGNYAGNAVGRKYSRTVAGAVGGAIFFGPVGMMAGIAGSQASKSKNNKPVEDVQKVFSSSSSQANLRDNKVVTKGSCKVEVENEPSKTSDVVGTTGVWVGAIAGAVALGPLGLIPGAYLGSVSGRKLVDQADKRKEAQPNAEAEYTICNEEGKKRKGLGKFTRHIVNRVKGKGSNGEANEQTFTF